MLNDKWAARLEHFPAPSLTHQWVVTVIQGVANPTESNLQFRVQYLAKEDNDRLERDLNHQPILTSARQSESCTGDDLVIKAGGNKAATRYASTALFMKYTFKQHTMAIGPCEHYPTPRPEYFQKESE